MTNAKGKSLKMYRLGHATFLFGIFSFEKLNFILYKNKFLGKDKKIMSFMEDAIALSDPNW